MSVKKVKSVGEGGAHRHGLQSPEKTNKDGMHKHLFFVGDRLLMTDLSGEHSHPVNRTENKTAPESQPHEHTITIQTEQGPQKFDTKSVTSHEHELQTSATTLSGLHTHEAELGGNTFLSLLPSDLLDEVDAAAKSVPALKDFKISNIKSEQWPTELDFKLIARLNKSDFKEVVKVAVERTVFKSLSTLNEGLHIESLILNRDRFGDIGVARRFVMDNGFSPITSLEGNDSASPFVFNVRSKDKFQEASLQRIQVTDGVIAVIGLLAASEKQEGVPEVEEGSGADALTENATTPEQKPTQSGSIESISDRIGKIRTRIENAKFSSKTSTKSIKKYNTQKFIFLKTGKELKGSVADELEEIANAHGVERKFVTVEYPEKRFVEVLTNTEKYEVVSASYSDTCASIVDDEAEGQEYKSLHVKGEKLEAFIITAGGLKDKYSKSLVIFFDDADDLDDIFKTEIKNYEFGVYQYKQTMMGPIIIPIINDTTVTPILDDELLARLKRDTELFFSAKSEKFFRDNKHKGLVYKRGLIMYGPPGNGKTTFIKYFISEHVENAYAILCEPQDFDGGMGKFLKQRLGKAANKVIVFEDVDAICDSYWKRAEFLNFLDGVNTIEKTLFIATTNYPHMLDSALMKRPSRFDQKYFIDLPNETMRTKFLKSFFEDLDDSDIQRAATQSEGFSGAMFKEVFILTGLQDITVFKAIKQMKAQMEIHKRAPKQIKKENFFDILFQKQSAISIRDKISEIRSSLSVSKPSHIDPKKPKKTKKNLGFFTIIKADEAKRLVTGPILLPEKFDLQNDIVSGEEITKAIHNYMVKLAFQNDEDFLIDLGLSARSERGFMHQEFSRKIAFVEMFVVNDDAGFMTMNKVRIENGTAIGIAKIFDDEIWSLVQAKKITGFSIGGRSQVVPAEEGAGE